MLNPKADTMSYYMNSLSSGLAPVHFLRWSWRAYLSMDNDNGHQSREDGETDEGNVNRKEKGHEHFRKVTLDKTLALNSNQYLVEKSPWYRNKSMWRLCDPASDLPSNLDSDLAPRFIITSAEGDPLHDDGYLFAKKLQEKGAKVSFTACRGSHILAFLLDTKKRTLIHEELRKAFFG